MNPPAIAADFLASPLSLQQSTCRAICAARSCHALARKKKHVEALGWRVFAGEAAPTAEAPLSAGEAGVCVDTA